MDHDIIIIRSKWNLHLLFERVNVSFVHSLQSIFKSLKLLKLDDILKLQELKFYYKFENSKLPCYLSKLPFIWNTIIHGYYTRINHKIYLLKPNNEYAKKCIQNNIPLLANNTRNNILEKIHTHSLQGFSTYLKHCYIESYKETCNIVIYLHEKLIKYQMQIDHL